MGPRQSEEIEGRFVPTNSWSDYDLVLHALRNELDLDKRDREKFSIGVAYFDYKVLKQVALRKRLGFLTSGFLWLIAVSIPAFLISKAALLCFFPLLPAKRVAFCRAAWAVPSTSTNEILVRSAVAKLGAGEPKVINPNKIFVGVGPLMRQRDRLFVICDVVRLLHRILSLNSDRISLFLHARDAIELLILVKFAKSRESDLFVTDCHYQRWSFVLSHAAQRISLVQHGRLDPDIPFRYRGGSVCKALVRDKDSADVFRRYYEKIGEFMVHSPYEVLEANRHGANAVFLASSFPSLDLEISFLIALRAVSTCPVIIKLHPVHRYDSRKADLISVADYVCRPDENPDCGVFVSHSSSMELLYGHWGIPTVSLSSECTIEAAVVRTLSYLNKSVVALKSDFSGPGD